MKIGIEAQRLFREKKHGIEIVALELIRQLQKIDLNNEYFIYVRKDKDNTCIQETSNFRIREIEAASYPEWEQIRLPLAAKYDNVDVLHCTANTAPLFTSVPVILTLHDIIFMEKAEFQGSHYQNFGNLYRRLLLPRIIKKVRRIITVSASEKSVIIHYLHLDPSRVDVVYNAADGAFRKLPAEALNKMKTDYQLPEKFILFFGSSAQKKNSVETVLGYLEYAQRNADAIPLVVAGAFEDQIKKELGKFDISSEIKAKIITIGYIPFHLQPALYNLAHLFLYTSTRESFGMPIIEAMACETPVITSEISAMPEIAGGAAQLVNPHDRKSIAEGISAVLAEPFRYEHLVQSGRTRALDFSWRLSAEKVLDIYTQIFLATK